MSVAFLVLGQCIGFQGCIKKNDTVIVVPITPSDLTGKVVSATQINLTWTDKSTNEKGFKVQRKTGTGVYADIASLGSDVTSYNDNTVTRNTTYTYRVYAFNDAGASLSYTNELNLNTWGDVQLTTTSITDITNTSARSSGNITSDGGSQVTARGVVWGTSPNPTVSLATKTSNGSGIGSFASNLDGLNLNTTYYVRAYATNSEGTFYGNELTFKTLNSIVCNQNDFNQSINYGTLTDQEGNVYKTVSIGSQIWMAENLRTGRFRNGDQIPNVTNTSIWAVLTSGAFCWYNNDSTSNHCLYGRLYNLYAVYDARNLCPSGWHVPSDGEWTILTNSLGGQNVAGEKMKITSGWLNNGNGSNSSGFTGRPGGYRLNVNNPAFLNLGTQGYWWTNTATTPGNAWYRVLHWGADIQRNSTDIQGAGIGFSVRCVKD